MDSDTSESSNKLDLRNTPPPTQSIPEGDPLPPSLPKQSLDKDDAIVESSRLPTQQPPDLEDPLLQPPPLPTQSLGENVSIVQPTPFPAQPLHPETLPGEEFPHFEYPRGQEITDEQRKGKKSNKPTVGKWLSQSTDRLAECIASLFNKCPRRLGSPL